MTKHLLARTLRLLSLALIFGFGSSVANAQLDLTIGDGNGSTSFAPIYSYYGYTYSQSIVLQEAIEDAGGEGGIISSIRFYYQSGNTNNSTANWSILLGNTNKNSFSGNSDWEDYSNLTQVYSGSVTVPASEGWMEIILDTPFAYTGGNLLVATDENTPGFSSFPAASWGFNQTGTAQSIYYYSDGTNPNPQSPPNSGGFGSGTLNGYNYMQMVVTPFEECSGTLDVGAAILSSLENDTLCEGAAENLSISLENSYVTFSGIDYQWQQNIGDGWEDIEGETNSNLNITSPNETTQYRATVTCTASSETDISDPVEITIAPLPVVAITPGSYAICTDGEAILTATGADSYVWSPDVELSGTTGASVTTTATEQRNYSVVGTDANGCTNTASASVIPVQDVTISTITNPTALCESGELVIMDVDNTPEGVSGGGNWEFQWLDADTNVVQAWSAISQYAFTPAEDGNYNYYVQMQSSTCPEDTIFSYGNSNIQVGFGAEANTVDVNCNTPQGSIILSDIFGQLGEEIFYSNDFTSSFDADTTVEAFDNTQISDGRLVLTESLAGVRGSFSIYPEANDIYWSHAAYSVSFDMTADQPLNNFGTGGGDGLSYSFGDDAQETGGNNPGHGRGSKLRVIFDSADNSGSNGNSRGVYLTYGYTGTAQMGPNSQGVLGYNTNMSWKTATDVPVEINVSADGKVTVILGGTILFNNVQLPPEYLEADQSTWVHTFGAHTGGDALRHAIDNLEISYKGIDFGITEDEQMPTEWQGESTFANLEPGTYNVWMANASDSECSSMIGTYEINDINPVVELGEEINICEGETTTLDAGNEGSTYLWSDDSMEQTLEVSTTGSYWVMVTDTAGCTDIDAISINVAQPSSVDGITVVNDGLDAIITAQNPQNVDTYEWDFGDGTTLTSNSATELHTYPDFGEYTVSVTVSSAVSCEDATASEVVDIATSITEISASDAGLSIYPNPAQNNFTIGNEEGLTVERVEIYDISGKLVLRIQDHFNADIQLRNLNLEGGLYFIKVHSPAGVFELKLINRQ
ncbi:T9SS type A sorting domain-containing protein [Halocola ammonii]